MACPDYNICDVCKGQTKLPRLFVETSYEYNGVENVAEGTYLDLCPACTQDALRCMIANPNVKSLADHDQCKRLLKWFEEKRSR